jgi:hypothetical protein
MRSHPHRFRPDRRRIVTSSAHADRQRDDCPSCGRQAVRTAAQIRANLPCRDCDDSMTAIWPSLDADLIYTGHSHPS